MRLTAQDHIWTLNNGGVLTATWTNHGGNQIPAYFVLKGNSIKLTGDPGATGGQQVVCCHPLSAPSVILVSSPPLAMCPCPFLMAMMTCKAPCLISFWWPLLPFLMWPCYARALAFATASRQYHFSALIL